MGRCGGYCWCCVYCWWCEDTGCQERCVVCVRLCAGCVGCVGCVGYALLQTNCVAPRSIRGSLRPLLCPTTTHRVIYILREWVLPPRHSPRSRSPSLSFSILLRQPPHRCGVLKRSQNDLRFSHQAQGPSLHYVCWKDPADGMLRSACIMWSSVGHATPLQALRAVQ